MSINKNGANNPNWKGGKKKKKCLVCGKEYFVIPSRDTSLFCSLQCVGAFQKGKPSPRKTIKRTTKTCEVCGIAYSCYASSAHKYHCCSKACSHRNRSIKWSGRNSPTWKGGLSRLPYPWNFKEISKKVIERDNYVCKNPLCGGSDQRLVTHHINYDKMDCGDKNLITLCSACNSKANFDREKWQEFYLSIAQEKTMGVRVVFKGRRSMNLFFSPAMLPEIFLMAIARRWAEDEVKAIRKLAKEQGMSAKYIKIKG